MKKTYNCNSKQEAKEIIAKIIKSKIKQNTSSQKITININGDIHE